MSVSSSKQPRLEQHRDLGRERVVVAEGDLVGGRGVVLVDHRHEPPAQQRLERAAGVHVAVAAVHVAGGQKHLGGGRAVTLEGRLPAALQHRLTHRRGGLEFVQAARPGAALERPDAERDRARADHHHRRARRRAVRPPVRPAIRTRDGAGGRGRRPACWSPLSRQSSCAPWRDDRQLRSEIAAVRWPVVHFLRCRATRTPTDNGSPPRHSSA